MQFTQVARAGSVALQGQAGTVLIPMGVALGLGGALLALWHESRRVDVSLTAGPGGGGIHVGGARCDLAKRSEAAMVLRP